ncbi:MAG: type II toxin-antitoxin system YhaV family toxin [Gallionella sp.]|nr:type II toxin-antitoxin system YhaV family toxin [Gallionella sp.]
MLESKIIVYAWVNDENTKRAYGSDTYAYQAFQRMLKNGKPPDDWLNQLAEAKRASRRISKK